MAAGKLKDVMIIVLFVETLLLFATATKSSRRADLEKEELEIYTKGHDIDDYDFTTPVFMVPVRTAANRTRRSDLPPIPPDDDREVKFQAFGEKYHIRLKRNKHLLSKGLVVERVDEHGNIREEEIKNRHCHYFGELLSHDGPSAGALSMCTGLRGVISHGESDVYIAPLKDHHASRLRRDANLFEEEDHAHIVYKRSAFTHATPTPTFQDGAADPPSDNQYDSMADEDFNIENETVIRSDNYCGVEKFNTDDPDSYMNESIDFEYDSQVPSYEYDDQGEYYDYDNESRIGMTADMAGNRDNLRAPQEGGERYLEACIVIDELMNAFHGDDLIEYTLDLMNIAARRYAESTLGAQIKIVIVRIIVAEQQKLSVRNPAGRKMHLQITANGGKLLEQLCKFSKKINYQKDSNAKHWDLIMLLTRRDLYSTLGKRKDYGLLGRAYLGMVCNPNSACSVNQDDGLESGFVISHETGHNLNLQHDPVYGCENQRNVMSSSRTTGPQSFLWSTCSAYRIVRFLESHLSDCLRDEPKFDHPDATDYKLLPFDDLPGERYDRRKQCRLTFGTQFNGRMCFVMNSRCGRVGCLRNGHCAYVQLQEGTSCGVDRWCVADTCQSSIGGLPPPVHGGWTPFEGSYNCSAECGTGLYIRQRFCTSPQPMFGGDICHGPHFESAECNTQPCSPVTSADDVRKADCRATFHKKYGGARIMWSHSIDARLSGNELCHRFCYTPKEVKAIKWFRATKYKPIKLERGALRGVSSDGIRCWHITDDTRELSIVRRCMLGECKEIGCDGVYYSRRRNDVCGVCEGTGRTCKLVEGKFNGKPLHYRWWWLFKSVPVGSTGIRFYNGNARYNKFGLMVDQDKIIRPPLGKRSGPERISIGKNIIVHNSGYKQWPWESFTVVSGPTTVKLKIQAFQDGHTSMVGAKGKASFKYKWYQPLNKPVSYFWTQEPITNCSAPCDGGNITMSLTCVEELLGEYADGNDYLCDSRNLPKPSVHQECNTALCSTTGGLPPPSAAQWLVGEWNQCSVKCGNGTVRRTVHCVNSSTFLPLPKDDCVQTAGYEPSNNESCFNSSCLDITPTVADIVVDSEPLLDRGALDLDAHDNKVAATDPTAAMSEATAAITTDPSTKIKNQDKSSDKGNVATTSTVAAAPTDSSENCSSPQMFNISRLGDMSAFSRSVYGHASFLRPTLLLSVMSALMHLIAMKLIFKP